MYPKLPRGATTLALLLGLAACKDGTGPDGTGPSPQPEPDTSQAEVRITATMGEPAWVTEGGVELIQCSVALVATATGRPNATAVWDRAVFRWHVGPDQAVVDSVVASAGEVIDSWGGNTITVGQSLTSGWWFRSDAPFILSADYHYGASGARIDRMASWRAACGPQLPPGGAPAPTLTASLATSRGGVAPGDTVMITYTASSPVGLLETVVEIAGAHDTQIRHGERFAPSVTRTVPFVVPQMVLLGEPLRVTVHAVDVGLQVTSQPLPPTPALTDNQPPEILFTHLGGRQPEELWGSFPVGDTLYLQATARDNYGVSALVVEVRTTAGTLRDSVSVSGYTVDHRFALPVPRGWEGATGQLRVRAWDGWGNRSSDRSSGADALHFYASPDRPMRSVILAGRPVDWTLDTRRDRVYLLQAGRVAAVSLATLGEVASLALPGAAAADLTMSGDTLLVLLPGERALAVVDPARLTVTSRIPLETGGRRPGGMRVAANGRVLVALGGTGTLLGTVLEVDPARGTQRLREDAAGIDNAFSVAGRSLDHGRVAVVLGGCARVYSVAEDRFSACQRIDRVSPITGDATGRRFAQDRHVYDDAMRLVKSWPYAVEGAGMDPDPAYGWVFTPLGMIRARVDDGVYVERLKVPIVEGTVLFAPGGEFLLALGRLPGGNTMQLTRVDMR